MLKGSFSGEEVMTITRVCESQDLTLRTLSSQATLSSCALIFTCYPWYATLQTVIDPIGMPF
jgi:hypothetical protein